MLKSPKGKTNESELKYIAAQFEYGIAHQLYTDGLITARQLDEIKRLIKIAVEAVDNNEN